MTTLHLVRHASAAHVGRVLSGRTPGVHLDERGMKQARDLGRRFAAEAIAAVVSSPLERARETAAAIATPHGLEVEIGDAFDEVDFGLWTGMRFDELAGRADWDGWNRFRSLGRPPGGEAMTDVLGRALDGVRDLVARHGAAPVVVVSHGDVIRALLTHFLGMPFDLIHRTHVDPASVSTVEVHAWGPRVLWMNRTAAEARD